MIGVSKAYVTRVGEGPFPTELFGEDGEWLRAQGHEYGVTTGRPRRCGWFDAVVNRYAAQVNGLTDIVLTKLDVLTGLKEIPLCVAYDVNGERRDDMPTDQAEFAAAKRFMSPCRVGTRTFPRSMTSTICRRPARITSSVLRNCPAVAFP